MEGSLDPLRGPGAPSGRAWPAQRGERGPRRYMDDPGRKTPGSLAPNLGNAPGTIDSSRDFWVACRPLEQGSSAGVGDRQRGNSSVGRAPPCQGGGRRFESGFPLCCIGSRGWEWRRTPSSAEGRGRTGGRGRARRLTLPFCCWRRSQVVRQRTANPPSSVRLRPAPLKNGKGSQ